VKIAILDTGIQLSDQQMDIYLEERKIKYKSWVDEEKEGHEIWRDAVGHGTHLATLLVKVAPFATIHMARVFRNRRPNMKTEFGNVAQVRINFNGNQFGVTLLILCRPFDMQQITGELI
jgi:Subtilase family